MATRAGIQWLAQLALLAGAVGCADASAPAASDGGRGLADASADATDGAVAADASGNSGVDSVASDGAGVDSAAPLGPPPKALTVHEWATFTAFQAVNGNQYVGGVQRNEEALPAFVHQRQLGPPQSGASETVAAPILAKVQTAGAFFGAQSAGELEYKLTLPAGAVVADWPPAVEVGPAPLAAGKLANGTARWRLRVDPAAGDPAGDAGTLFQPLRKVGAATVAPTNDSDKAERFLFYRAVADFVPPVRVIATKAARIANGYDVQVMNDGTHEIPRAFLINLHSGGGLLQEFYAVPAGGVATRSATPKEMPNQHYSKVKTVLANALGDAGLSAAESTALVETFTHNWLKTFGLRLIVVAPSQWVDKWLPVSVTPAPVAHSRVLLGRIELLTIADEGQLLTDVKQSHSSGDLGVLNTFGFFAEPTARRMLALADSPGLQQFCQGLVEAAVKVK